MRVGWAFGAFPGKCSQDDRTPVNRQVGCSVLLEYALRHLRNVTIGDPAQTSSRTLNMALRVLSPQSWGSPSGDPLPAYAELTGASGIRWRPRSADDLYAVPD